MKKSVKEKMKVKKSKCIVTSILFMLLVLFIMLFENESLATEKYGEFYELQDNCITRILPQTTLRDLKNNLEKDSIQVTNTEGNILEDNEYVGTGMSLVDGEDSYTLCIIGDADGNGRITITDITKISLHKNNLKKLDGAYVLSADINNDGKISITDVVQINLVLVNLKDIMAPSNLNVEESDTEDSITITGSSTDSNQENLEYYFKIDDGEWIQNNDKTNGTYTFTDIDRYVDHTVIMKIKDNVGNEKKSEKIIVNALEVENAEYKVIHKQMNVDGQSYTEVETDRVVETGKVGDEITPEVKDYEGFTAPQTQTTTIAADGSTTITYLYERNKYTFTLGTGIGANTEGSTVTGEYYHGATITLKLTAIEGYENSTWTSNNENLVPSPTQANTTFIMPIGNITMIPNATKAIVNGIFATLYDTDNDEFGDTLVYTANNRTLPEYGTQKEQYDITNEITNVLWTNKKDSIKNAVIFDNIEPTSTKKFFANLCEITSIENINKLNTSNVTNMSYMFSGCSKLTNIDFNSSNTSQIPNINGYGNLLSSDVNNFDTSNVTDMSYMFNGCSSLTSLDLSGLDTSNITNVEGMFNNCNGLTSLNLSNFNTSNITGSMRDLFNGCSGLTSLDLSGFNTSNITDMSYMFNGCSGLTNLDLSSFDVSSVVRMISMFSGCNNLTNLLLSNFNISTSMAWFNMFKDCTLLQNIYGNTTWVKVNETPNGSFDNCGTNHVIIDTNTSYTVVHKQMDLNGTTYTIKETENLTGEIGAEITPEVKTYEGFTSPDTQTTNILPDGKTEVIYLYERNKYHFTLGAVTETGISSEGSMQTGEYYFGTPIVLELNADNGYGNLQWTSSNGELIADSTKGKTIFTMPAGEITMSPSASEVSNTVYATLYDADNDGVEDTYVFTSDNRTLSNYGNKIEQYNLTNTHYEYFSDVPWRSRVKNIKNVKFEDKIYPTSISLWFYGFSNLENIEGIEKLDTSNATDMERAFFGCTKLSDLDVGEFDTGNVVSMSYMFYSCKNLTDIDISNFNMNKVTKMDYMFGSCGSLKSVNLSYLNAYNVTNMNDMFYECNSIENINLTGFKNSKPAEMSYMFTGCKNLENLNLDNIELCCPSKMDGMFNECNSLTNIDLSKFDTSNTTTMLRLFYNCKGLTNINLGTFDVSKVTSMADMFYNCCNLSSIDIEEFDTSSVTDMQRMFYNCEKITQLNVTNFNTENVTYMNGMFCGCTGLTQLDLSNFNTGNVKNMKQMFSGCFNLEELNLSNFDTSKVTNMFCMFFNCKNISNLNISSFNTACVTDMAGMFCKCSGLTQLNVSNFNTENVIDMKEMFYNCYGLTELNLNNFNTSNVTSMGYMFGNCRKLAGLNLSSFDTTNVTNMQGMFDKCKDMTTLNISNFNTNNVTNMKYMFYKCANLTSFTSGQNWTTDNADKLYIYTGSGLSNETTNNIYAKLYDDGILVLSSTNTEIDGKTVIKDFEDIDGEIFNSLTYPWDSYEDYITHVKIEDEIYPTSAAYLFYHLKNASHIENLSNIKANYVTNMQAMFASGGFTELDLRNIDTSNVIDMSSMFDGCDKLVNLDLSTLNTSSVTNMSYMFNFCEGLTNLDVSNLNTENVMGMMQMFCGCRSLTSLDLSNFNTSKVVNMRYMFGYCNSLTNLDVHSFNTENVINIVAMFNDCSSLTELDLRNFNLNKIETFSSLSHAGFVFAGCTNLTTIYANSTWAGINSSNDILGNFQNCGTKSVIICTT